MKAIGIKGVLIILLSTIVFFMHFPKPSYATENDSPNVMIIHSYDLSYQWTQKQDEGLRQRLLEEYPKANIYTEILDAQRFDLKDIFSRQMEFFIDKYSEVSMDIILATDDTGLEFALAAREAMGLDVPIAFSGVLESAVPKYVGNQANVTGVYEIRGFTRMIELMRLLQPNANKVVIINDTSTSSRQLVQKVLEGFEELNLSHLYTIEHWEEKTYEDLLRDVRELDKDTAAFLISYHKSYDGVIKTGQVFCKEISEASTVPLYSLGELYFGSGLTGGEFLSGTLQGNALAEIAIKIIKGTDADSIPYYDQSTSYLGVDENMTRKYGIHNIPLPEDTVIINESFTFYEQYRSMVIAVISTFIVLLGFILGLLIQRKTIKSTNYILKAQAETMQILYEQVSSSEEKLSAQNKELKYYQKQLQHEVDHDYLTGLSKRSMQEKLVNDLIRRKQGNKGKLICIFIDLDNFKYINNSMGHHAGDMAIKEISRRLFELKNSFNAARIGGDEFVLIYECQSADMCAAQLASITEDLKKVFALPIRIGEEVVTITGSIGCSLYPDDAATYDQMIIRADLAMYEAKKNKKGMMIRFDENIKKASDRYYRLGKEMSRGLKGEEFYLVYQPIMISDGSSVNSLEALLRWESSVFGSVLPSEFIPAAEIGGHMIELGDWVLEMAVKFLADNAKAFDKVQRLSINVSVVQFYEENFTSKLLAKLDRYNVSPQKIQLEIVESIVINSYDLISEKLNELRSLGITIALDDFGTGYSSLSYLNKLPIDILKIDKRFIDDIKEDSTRNMIVDTISILAKSLSLDIVAEGVENEFQMNYIRDCGIQYIQGYYYSKPIKEDEVIDFIQSRNN